MWAYNAILKCTVNGGRNVLSSAWQGSPSISKCAHSTIPVKKMFLSAKRPLFVVTSVFRACAHGKVVKRNIHVSRWMQSTVDTNVAKDVVIFKYDNVKLHKLITLFGIVNYFMFMSVSANIYTLLTTPKSAGEQSSELDNDSNGGSSYSPVYTEPSNTSSSFEVAEGSTVLNETISSTFVLKALCGVTFTLGMVILVGSYVYCNHVVRYIVLHKGGKRVTVVAHGYFAKNRYRSLDVDQVSCRGNRSISSAVLLNVKGKYLSYILDKKGSYTNPQLFDATVGVLRDLRK